MRIVLATLAIILATLASPLLAHPGQPINPDQWYAQWLGWVRWEEWCTNVNSTGCDRNVNNPQQCPASLSYGNGTPLANGNGSWVQVQCVNIFDIEPAPSGWSVANNIFPTTFCDIYGEAFPGLWPYDESSNTAYYAPNTPACPDKVNQAPGS